jgi:hypothetical protein
MTRLLAGWLDRIADYVTGGPDDPEAQADQETHPSDLGPDDCQAPIADWARCARGGVCACWRDARA